MPDFILQLIAAELADELRNSRLEVCKIRSRGGWIRVAVSTNPEWYSQLCRYYEKPRRRYPKPRTVIKRIDTLKALDRLASGLQAGPVYRERLQEIIEQEAIRRGHWSPKRESQMELSR